MTRGSIWWVEFDPARGSEIRKTRPAIIVSNDIANQCLSRVVVVPVTSNTSRIYPGEAIVTINGVRNKAMSDQIMSADKSRVKNKIGRLSDADILSLEKALCEFLNLSPFISANPPKPDTN